MIIIPFKMSLYKVKFNAKLHWGSDILIFEFEFEKKSKKRENTIFEKSTIIWNILKIHWIIVILEVALMNAFEDEQ